MSRFFIAAVVMMAVLSGTAAVTSFNGSRRPAKSAAVAARRSQTPNDKGLELVAAARRNLSAALENLRRAQEQEAAPDEIRRLRHLTVARRRELRRAYERASGYFLAASDRNDADGCYNLGLCYLEGNGVVRDEARAVRLFERAVDTHAQEFDFDPAEEVESARREQRDIPPARAQAIAGYAAALNQLGECLREGVGCTKDVEAATARFLKSASLGNSRGEYNYGLAQLAESVGAPDAGSLPPSVTNGVAYLKRAALKRLPEAMDAYAKCLMDGTGFQPRVANTLLGESEQEIAAVNEAAMEKRRHEAVAWWFNCATEHQYPAAMIKLATCFRDGLGVEKRASAAVYWFYRAAMDYDDVTAMREMARCCEEGLGGLDAYGGAARRHFNANWWKTRARATEGDRLARIWLNGHEPDLFDRLKLAETKDGEKPGAATGK